ncbi:MAG: hypothetical protein KY442_10920 [Proteobacteria bacterium]|nr:hypothetical protein [Pseudomonadota bacterium]
MAGAKGRSPRRNTTQPGDAANPKRSESERISAHIADFERSGGRVEVLGTTRVLQKVDAPREPVAAAAPAKVSKTKR